jgi:hypothetical protein
MIVSVELYSGTVYAERPLACYWQGRRLEVSQVLRSWRTPAGPGFDVRVADGRRFRIELDESSDAWTIQERL